MLAKLDPVDSETTQQMKKVASKKPAGPSCHCTENQISASTNPVRVMSTPMVLAKIQAVIMIMMICWDIPEITTSEKAFRSLANNNPNPRATISMGHKPRSSGAPESAMKITPTRKTKNGSSIPQNPP